MNQRCVQFTTTVLLLLAAAVTTPAQTFSTLVIFDGANGSQPSALLTQGTDGNFYGSTQLGPFGPKHSSGVLFQMTPAGVLTVMHRFINGNSSFSGLTEGNHGYFYGTTTGGYNGLGTIFRMRPSGKVETLHRFQKTNGAQPYRALVRIPSGDFYGSSQADGPGGHGTIFRLQPDGKMTTMVSFNGRNGSGPVASPILATDGKLYGTTEGGIPGAYGYGTIYAMTTSGQETVLHRFQKSEGEGLSAALVEGSDGNFYGTAIGGGANDYGSVFSISPRGKLTVLHSFNGTDGSGPECALVEAADGNFYGTTPGGGAGNCTGGCGTIFSITPAGVLTTLYNFDVTASEPRWGLRQGTDGAFYGTTIVTENALNGIIFKFDMGFAPFVKTSPHFGRVGTTVQLLGSNLTGATAVSFNGTNAAFTVVSPTEITTTVPSGATSGSLSVITPAGTLASDVKFLIR